jgi:hypothetical protein
MRGFSGRLPWSWNTNSLWFINGNIWNVVVKAPENVTIPKQRYWAVYDPEFHEFIISGVEKNNVIDIEDAPEKTKINASSKK